MKGEWEYRFTRVLLATINFDVFQKEPWTIGSLINAFDVAARIWWLDELHSIEDTRYFSFAINLDLSSYHTTSFHPCMFDIDDVRSSTAPTRVVAAWLFPVLVLLLSASFLIFAQLYESRNISFLLRRNRFSDLKRQPTSPHLGKGPRTLMTSFYSIISSDSNASIFLLLFSVCKLFYRDSSV